MWFLGLALQLAVQHHAAVYQVRLEQEISIHANPATEFSAVVVGAVEGAEASLPLGTRVLVRVKARHATGLGVRRERDTLQLEFAGCRLPTGQPHECHATLLSVDNARETVARGNRIHGIVRANHPHSVANGIWILPGLDRIGRSGLGLTGAGGVIDASLFSHPLASLALVVPRLVFWRLPEGDIHFPPGTDLMLQICHAPLDYAATEPLEHPLGSAPATILQASGKPAADIINIAITSTREQLERAFRAAGWSDTHELTAKSFKRLYGAFARMHTYPEAPVSPMFYEGRRPDLVFQKSLNTLAKRHHIRFWRQTWQGSEYWLGAATHDVAMQIDWPRFNFTHWIDPKLDRERSVVRNDLQAAACVSRQALVARPHEARTAPESFRVTDGHLLLLELQPCGDGPAVAAGLTCRPRSQLYRGARRITLETRNYALRGNPYYHATRMLRARRQQPDALMIR